MAPPLEMRLALLIAPPLDLVQGIVNRWNIPIGLIDRVGM